MFLPPLSMCIDLVTLSYSGIKRAFIRENCKSRHNCGYPSCDARKIVSVFIPIYNEAEKIRSTVDCIIQQTHPPKNIFLLDDLSTDSSKPICKELEEKYSFVNHVRREVKLGKAGNINALVANSIEDFGDFILVVDGDVKLHKDCIEELLKESEDAAVVTGFGYTSPPDAYMPKMLYEGMSWINSVFSFRKKAQVIRNSVFVICGALALYRKEVLVEVPIPERTSTEDTDYTWLVQEHNYRIKYASKAQAVGKNPNSLIGFWKRHERWFAGTFQCLFVHGFRDLNKSKSLLYSTILPGCFEVIPYSVTLTFMPLLFFLWPSLATGILIADFVLSFPFLFFHRKGFLHAVNHLPDIYFYKFFGSYVCFYSGIKTTLQVISGQKDKWVNNWENSSRINYQPISLTRGRLKKHMEDCQFIEKEWTGLGEKAWTKDNFLLNKRKKWKLSNCIVIHGKLVAYSILSQIGEKEAYLHKILVDSKCQGLGIGSLLFKDSIQKCRKHNIEQLHFKVRVENGPANAIYKKNNVSYYDKEISDDGVERHICRLSV